MVFQQNATKVVFELPSPQQTQLMMASNDIISTVMYWIIWDLADCALPEVPGAPVESLTWLWICHAKVLC